MREVYGLKSKINGMFKIVGNEQCVFLMLLIYAETKNNEAFGKRLVTKSHII